MTEIDELAGDEGKTWHPSTSPCAHARHTPQSLTDPGRDGDGPPPEILFDFEIDDTFLKHGSL
jgi:hypothetical protein